MMGLLVAAPHGRRGRATLLRICRTGDEISSIVSGSALPRKRFIAYNKSTMTRIKLFRTPLPARTFLFVGLLLLWVGTLAIAPSRAQNSDNRWHSDLKRAAEISAKTNKPIFLVFRCVR